MIRVLVAESDPSRTASICEILLSDDRVDSVTSVGDGAAAIAGADSSDVVVIDLAIKGLGCFGAIGRIHRLANPPRVVAVDPVGDDWKDLAARGEGADEVLVWPRDTAVLVDAVTGSARCSRSKGRQS